MSKYIDNGLENIIKTSTNWKEVCLSFGIKPATGSQTYIKSVAIKYNLDFSHFTGKYHNKDKSVLNKRNINDYLVCDGPFITTHKLKLKLFKEGLKERKCEQCGIEKWLDKPAPLELDHIDGNNRNNEFSNLRILCCNCHACTPTYSGKKLKKEAK